MDYYEYIDDYISGKLSDELRKEFESAMKSDSSLRLAVDNYDDAKSISEGLLEIDMMATINKLKAEKGQDKTIEENFSKSNASIFTIRRLMAAASVIGLIAIATWWFNGNSNLQKELWNKSYSAILDPDAVKSGDGVEGKDPLATVKHYYARNYNEECIESAKRLISVTTNADTLSLGYLYLGDTYMKRSYHQGVNEWKEAISAFEKSKEADAGKRKQLAIDLSEY